jgi:hypothetical protein
MGNTDIPLPSDMIKIVPNPSIGIPAGPTRQESRSVLKDEIAIGGSPRALMVLPAHVSQVRKSPTAGSQAVVRSWAEIASS